RELGGPELSGGDHLVRQERERARVVEHELHRGHAPTLPALEARAQGESDADVPDVRDDVRRTGHVEAIKIVTLIDIQRAGDHRTAVEEEQWCPQKAEGAYATGDLEAHRGAGRRDGVAVEDAGARREAGAGTHVDV